MSEVDINDETVFSPVFRWVLAFFSILFGFIMILWAQGQETWKLMPGVFCFLIAGACILPQPVKGWCGSVVAIGVVFLAVWFFYIDYKDPQPGSSPLRFGLVFGVPALLYLLNKYASLFRNKEL